MSDLSLVGQTIGRFEILSELGRGGMAVVYKARQTDLDRIVALKILPPSLTSDQSYIARFRQEARSAARLEHPHIMPIYEVGEVAGYHYIAMKFIKGRTLKQLLEQEGALPVKRAAQILAQVGEALDYAHRQGIIHRDIKPSNVMITDEGWIYLTDFGLARGVGSGAGGLTMAGTVMGTPEYMSPEQAQGLPNVGPPTDIYALGVMLYELLTGAFPFKAETPMAMLAARLVHAPIPPRDVRGDLPPAVEDVIMRALARKPEARFASAAEMVAALRQAVGMSESELSRPLTPQRGMPAAVSSAPSRPGPERLATPPPAYGTPATPPPAYGTPATPPPVYVQTPAAPVAQPYSAAPTAPAPNPLNIPAAPAKPASKGAPVGIIAGIIVVLILVGGGIAAFVFLRPTEPTVTTSKAEPFIAEGDAALARTGGLADAISAYRSAITADANNMTAHARLASALFAQGSWQDAIAATEPLLASTDTKAQAIGHSISGYAYFQLGDVVQARAAGKAAIAADESIALGHALYAATLASNAADSRDNRLMDEAFAAIGNAEDRLNTADPLSRALAQALIGWAFGQDFRLRNDPNVLEQAITNLEAAIDSYPTLAFFHYELGTIYLVANNPETATAEFKSALELDPNFSPAQAGIGLAAYVEDNTSAARQAFNRALQLNAEESLALFGLGKLAFDDDQWDEAIDYFQQALDSNPHSAMAYGYLGEAKLFAGFNSTDQAEQDALYREAEEAYREAIARDDYFVLAHNGLGWILQYQERYKESIEAFERARQLDDQEAEIFNGLGWSLFFSDRYAEAEPMFKRATELDPTYASAYFGLGRSYEELGRRAEALAAFQETKRLDPDYRGVDEAIARVSN
ncbi:MAG: tetratricopeptide repeat protein [Chloroflexus sp.]|nr:tetratricopeptide repeat protein [Chloroflexus sp.]